MNLKKATELLTYSHKYNTILLTQDDKDALKLGIEALKRIRAQRQIDPELHQVLLPGETPE